MAGSSTRCLSPRASHLHTFFSLLIITAPITARSLPQRCSSLVSLGSGDSRCPLSSPEWQTSPLGVPGGVSNAGRLQNCPSSLLYAYSSNSHGFPGSFPSDPEQCRALCEAWPQFVNAPLGTLSLEAYSGSTEPCYFWSYDGLLPSVGAHGAVSNAPTCYLFDSTACSGEKSFKKGSTGSSNWRSGGVHNVSSQLLSAKRSRAEPKNLGLSPGKHVCAISDSRLHLNFLYQESISASSALAWIREIGILWGTETVTVTAREVASWQYDSGSMASFLVSGDEMRLDAPGAVVKFKERKIEIKWLEAASHSSGSISGVDLYELKLGNDLHMRLKLRPEEAYLGEMLFQVELLHLEVSAAAQGTVGQAYARDHRQTRIPQAISSIQSPVGKDPLQAYECSGILRTDCDIAQFLPPNWPKTLSIAPKDLIAGRRKRSNTASR